MIRACSSSDSSDRSNAGPIDRANFYVTTEDEYVAVVGNELDDFNKGVNILEELSENGIISEEEESRRVQYLKQYFYRCRRYHG